MSFLNVLQGWILYGLSLAALGIEIFAVVDCLRARSDAFPAADKRSKGFWLAVTGVAALVGLATLGSPSSLGILGIAAVVAAGVYLADVRPALRRVTGKSSQQGPYGPW